MLIETLEVGNLGTNCYLVADETGREAVVIDPGDEAERILGGIKKLSLNVKMIVLTHGHFDHVMAAGAVKEATGAKIAMHQDDVALLKNEFLSSLVGIDTRGLPSPDWQLKGWENIGVGRYSLSVLHTPGHSPGGICLVAPDAVFSGDTLFNMSIGRSDLPGGDFEQLMDSINKRLMLLDDDLAVYPGHGAATTIGNERRHNPFLADAPRKHCKE